MSTKLTLDLEEKLNKIISLVKNKKVIVAFSGGVDSSLLAFIAKQHAKQTLLITEKSILYPDEEIEGAKKFALQYEIPHEIIMIDSFQNVQFKNNPENRCYICKMGLYRIILEIKEERSFDIVLDGSNFDDLSDYRPGMKALQELNVSTPYIEYKTYIAEGSNS